MYYYNYIYFTEQASILPRVQPPGPGMGGQSFETPCMYDILMVFNTADDAV